MKELGLALVEEHRLALVVVVVVEVAGEEHMSVEALALVLAPKMVEEAHRSALALAGG